MELLQLRYFKEAAELENFSQVAKNHSVPQPSISATIHKLESELGVCLFDRNGKKICLNENGAYFYEKIASAIQNIDDGIAHFTNPKQTNIKIYIQAGNRYVSMVTADFLTSSTDIYVSAINSVSSHNLSDYDFTFMQPLADMSAYQYKHLMDDAIVLVVAVSHPLSSCRIVSLKDLKNEAFVGYYPTMNLRAFTDDYCRKTANFTPNTVFETHDASSLRYMIEKNKGIALMPKNFFSLQPSNHLKMIPLKEQMSRELIIAWDKNKHLSPQATYFKDFAIEWFQSME